MLVTETHAPPAGLFLLLPKHYNCLFIDFFPATSVAQPCFNRSQRTLAHIPSGIKWNLCIIYAQVMHKASLDSGGAPATPR